MMGDVLILGATGMLGHSLLYHLDTEQRWQVLGAVRDIGHLPSDFPPTLRKRLITGLNVEDFDSVIKVVAAVRPSVIINAVGLVKQGGRADDPLSAIAINSQFPHRLAHLCRSCGARLIHISTDCVFDGANGGYRETDDPSPPDLYGRSKLLGEVSYPHCLTLRTSLIGHEIGNYHGLLEWFLGQKGEVKGYSQAYFSGFPTVEFARILSNFVLPDQALTGLFHLSSSRIAKSELLHLIAKRYKKVIEIKPCLQPRIDRSLDSSAFRERTGYIPPTWEELVEMMCADFQSSPIYRSRQYFGGA